MSTDKSEYFMRFPLPVSATIVVFAIALIGAIISVVRWLQEKPLQVIPLIVAAVIVLVAGWVALIVTAYARKHPTLHPLNGLIGVSCLMFVPIIAVVLTHFVVEKTDAQLVFGYVIGYYLLFLPVGTWLLLPPRPSAARSDTKQNTIEK